FDLRRCIEIKIQNSTIEVIAVAAVSTNELVPIDWTEYTPITNASVARIAPSVSIDPFFAALKGKYFGAIRNTARPIGILIKNTQFHDSHCVITPPRKTPADPPAAAAAPQKPNAFPSSAGFLNTVINIVNAAGAINAEPSPCNARATLSTVSDHA